MHFSSLTPCKYGHVGLRYASNGSCVTCARVRARAREKALQAAGIKRVRNPEERKRTHARYSKIHRERGRLWCRIYRARRRGANGWHTPAETRALLPRQKYRCVYCRGSLRKRFDEDHIVPIARGGSNDITNIQLLCATCNRRKGATDPMVFAQRNGFLL